MCACYHSNWLSFDQRYACSCSINSLSVLSVRLMHVFFVFCFASLHTGVSWDPRGRYVLTQSSDRTCRLYEVKRGKGKSKQFVCTTTLRDREDNKEVSDKSFFYCEYFSWLYLCVFVLLL